MAATSGSDYKALWHTYGTPIADFRYIFDKVRDFYSSTVGVLKIWPKIEVIFL